jgi:hypothetical protein
MSTTQETPQAYCVKCKSKTDIAKAEKVTMKNGRAALKGHCTKCDTKVFRILGNAKKD